MKKLIIAISLIIIGCSGQETPIDTTSVNAVSMHASSSAGNENYGIHGETEFINMVIVLKDFEMLRNGYSKSDVDIRVVLKDTTIDMSFEEFARRIRGYNPITLEDLGLE